MKKGSVSRSQAILLGGYLSRLTMGLGITAIVGRTLDPDEFAFFTLLATIFFLSHLLFDLGTGSVVAREIVRHPEREQPLLEGMMGWRRFSGRLLAVAMLCWAWVETDSLRRVVLAGAAVAMCCMAPGALVPAFVVRQAQGGPESGRFTGHFVVFLGSIAFKVLGLAGALFGLLIVVREILNVVWVRFLSLRLLDFRPKASLRGRGLGAFLATAWVPACATVFQSVYFHLDVFLVPALRGEEELGAYAAAFRPINTLLVLPGLFMYPLLPVLTAAAKQDRERFTSYVRDAALLLLGIGALGGVAGALLARDLLEVLYGGRYLDGLLDSSTALRWMVLACAFVFASAAFNTALLADGREKILLRLAATGIAVNVLGNLVLIPMYGYTAAAFTTALTVFVVGGGSFLAVARDLNWRGLFPSRLLLLVPALGLAGILAYLEGPAWLRIGCGALLGLAGLIALAFVPGSKGFLRALTARSSGRNSR
jgi:O-antigen/teichoic acid export membrane protein